MEIFEVEENQKDKWNRLAATSLEGSLLQSFDWGAFQESVFGKVFRLAVADKDWLALALIIKHRLPLKKSYLYCPRGPIFTHQSLKDQNKKALQLLFRKIEQIAKEEKAVFLRLDPPFKEKKEEKQLIDLGFVKSSRDIQPKETIVLDIGKDEKELLAQMKPKTRYNIKLAQRKGVKVTISDNLKDIEVFLKILKKTSQRDKFRIHPDKYYQEMFSNLKNERMVELFLASYQNEIITANLVSFFGKRASYLHGALSYKHRRIMAPYLLQWQQILEAKKRGCQEYDFWGISPSRWPGVTRFKQGFGGRPISYLGTYDLIYQPIWFRIYQLVRKLK